MEYLDAQRVATLMSHDNSQQLEPSTTIDLKDLGTVHRLGFGAMRIVGDGVWGEPADRNAAMAVVQRAVELGVDFIDTADSYGPNISEEILAELFTLTRPGSRSPPRSVLPALAPRSGLHWAAPNTCVSRPS